jgi:hypothetical protein
MVDNTQNKVLYFQFSFKGSHSKTFYGDFKHYNMKTEASYQFKAMMQGHLSQMIINEVLTATNEVVKITKIEEEVKQKCKFKTLENVNVGA